MMRLMSKLYILKKISDEGEDSDMGWIFKKIWPPGSKYEGKYMKFI